MNESKTIEILVNNKVIYVYDGKVKMINLDRSKSKHGWTSNTYKVKGTKRLYIVAQKEKLFLDELKIEGIDTVYSIYMENREFIKTPIGKMTTFSIN